MRFLVPIVLTFFSCSGSSSDPASTGPQMHPGVVGETNSEVTQSSPGILAELFTSQGCSSCPPADKLLSTLSKESGESVISLAYHVDYWNYIGWQDPFSSAKWSSRQRAYSKQISEGRTYTPQLVVNGRDHVVGSRKKDVLAILGAQKQYQSPDISVSVTGEGEDDPIGSLSLVLDVSMKESRQGAELWIAVYENELVTQVKRGENAGRKLHNDRVVRHLENLGSLGQGQSSFKLDVPVQSGWRRDNLGAVAFVQESPGLNVTYAKELGTLWR